jgi:hypothetical protein
LSDELLAKPSLLLRRRRRLLLGRDAFFLNAPPNNQSPAAAFASSGSTHPSSTYFPLKSNRSPPSNSGIPKDIIGNGIPPVTASFDSAFAFARFFASIAFCSAAGAFY